MNNKTLTILGAVAAVLGIWYFFFYQPDQLYSDADSGQSKSLAVDTSAADIASATLGAYGGLDVSAVNAVNTHGMPLYL